MRALAIGLALVASPALAAPGDALNLAQFTTVGGWTMNPASIPVKAANRLLYWGGDHDPTGETQRFIYAGKCAAPDQTLDMLKTPYSADGWAIKLDPATAAQVTACKLGATPGLSLSAIITGKGLYVGGYGYTEWYGRLPAITGGWPAVWELPELETKANGGACPEVDVYEEYTGVNKGKFPADRTGALIATIHPCGGLPALSSGVVKKTLPSGKLVTNVVSDLSGFFSDGMSIEPTATPCVALFKAYLNRTEFWETTAPYCTADAGYPLINVAMAPGYTPSPAMPVKESYPDTFYTVTVRYYPLKTQP